MKYIIAIFLCLSFTVLNAQSFSQFRGKLNIYVSTGTAPNFTINGLFQDDDKFYSSDSILVGDIIYVPTLTRCAKVRVTAITSKTGGIFIGTVQDLDAVLTAGFKGISGIVRPTANRSFPVVPTGLPAKIEACMLTDFARMVDTLAGSAISGVELGYTASPANGVVTNNVGADATIPLATGTNAGLIPPADKTKLDNYPTTPIWTKSTTNITLTSTTDLVGLNATPVARLTVGETGSSTTRGIMSAQWSTDANGALTIFRKARGTEASPTTIVTADVLGGIIAEGHDGTNYLQSASILLKSEGTIASTRVPSKLEFYTSTNAAPSVSTLRMTINSSGEVGINASPSAGYKLYVNGVIRGLDEVVIDPSGGSGTVRTSGRLRFFSSGRTSPDLWTSDGLVYVGGNVPFGINEFTVGSTTRQLGQLSIFNTTSPGLSEGIGILTSNSTTAIQNMIKFNASRGSITAIGAVTAGTIIGGMTAVPADDTIFLARVASAHFIAESNATRNNAPTGFAITTGSTTSVGLTNWRMYVASDGKVGLGTFANYTATRTDMLNISGSFRLNGAFKDGANSAGTDGKVLVTTGSTTSWRDSIGLRRLTATGTTPSILIDANAGTSASATLDANAKAMTGIITLVLGSGSIVPGTFVTLTFSTPYATIKPNVFLSAGNEDTANLADAYWVEESTTGFMIKFSNNTVDLSTLINKTLIIKYATFGGN